MSFKRVTVKYEIPSIYGKITVEPNHDTSVHIKQEESDLIVIERKNLADLIANLIDALVEPENDREDS